VLIIDGLEKPGNIGALLRTADAARLDAVFLTGQGTDPYNPNVIRSSVGSVFSRPVLVVEAEHLLKWLEPQGFTLLAASPDTNHSYWDASYQDASAIILGTEHEGLSPFWKHHATLQVTIPMYGTADSLNVATAGALLIYEALRQRHRGKNFQD
jgi:TrmH family RNA methyltransferase